MNWFERLCRQTGLTIHQVIKPVERSTKQEIRRETQERQVNDKVTLRRTTIEEIEIKKE